MKSGRFGKYGDQKRREKIREVRRTRRMANAKITGSDPRTSAPGAKGPRQKPVLPDRTERAEPPA